MVEANKLGVPVIGVVDTNHSPEKVAYVIPGNDDSSRAIRLYARGIADAVLEGRAQAVEETVAAVRDEEFVEVEAAGDYEYDTFFAGMEVQLSRLARELGRSGSVLALTSDEFATDAGRFQNLASVSASASHRQRAAVPSS